MPGPGDRLCPRFGRPTSARAGRGVPRLTEFSVRNDSEQYRQMGRDGNHPQFSFDIRPTGRQPNQGKRTWRTAAVTTKTRWLLPEVSAGVRKKPLPSGR